MGAALLFAVKKEAIGDTAGFTIKIFLKTDGLSADLNFIGAVRFGSSAFVFNRNDPTVLMELNDIADPAQAVGIRPDRKASRNSKPRTRFALTGMGLLVQGVALRGGKIIGPKFFEVDEAALPRAIQVMLEG